jgi:ribosomal protein S18 acetylase RimI-like enzyme
MPAQIRRATGGDVAAMCEISQRAHRLGYAHLIPASHRAAFDARYDGSPKHRHILAARLRRALARKNWTVLVAEHDGTVVGYTLCERTAYGARKRGLFVDPDYQGVGIGNMLFASSLEGLDNKAVELLVVENNARATRLYEQHGFHSIGRSNVLYFGAHQIHMRRLPVVA